MTPYFVMFGREPKLPLDHMLGNRDVEGNKTLEEWVEKHRKRLAVAAEYTKESTTAKATKRQEKYNERATEVPIPLGTRVLLRNHPLGRKKIQDTWHATPYRVIDRLQENVYVIQLADGSGPKKSVHRTEIFDTKELIKEAVDSDLSSDDSVNDAEDSITEAEEMTEREFSADDTRTCQEKVEQCNRSKSPSQKKVQKRSSNPRSSDHSSDSSSSDGGWRILREMGRDVEDGNIKETESHDKAGKTDVQQIPKIVETTEPRRSKRATKGQHSNPTRQPRSVIERKGQSAQPLQPSVTRDNSQSKSSSSVNVQSIEEIDQVPSFEQFSQAVAMLGSQLGNSLGQTLQSGWSDYCRYSSK